MQRNKDYPNDASNGPRDPGTDSQSKLGNLVIRVRTGDQVQVGETLISVNEISMGYAKLGFRAPKTVKIDRKK